MNPTSPPSSACARVLCRLAPAARLEAERAERRSDEGRRPADKGRARGAIVKPLQAAVGGDAGDGVADQKRLVARVWWWCDGSTWLRLACFLAQLPVLASRSRGAQHSSILPVQFRRNMGRRFEEDAGGIQDVEVHQEEIQSTEGARKGSERDGPDVTDERRARGARGEQEG